MTFVSKSVGKRFKPPRHAEAVRGSTSRRRMGCSAGAESTKNCKSGASDARFRPFSALPTKALAAGSALIAKMCFISCIPCSAACLLQPCCNMITLRPLSRAAMANPGWAVRVKTSMCVRSWAHAKGRAVGDRPHKRNKNP